MISYCEGSYTYEAVACIMRNRLRACVALKYRAHAGSGSMNEGACRPRRGRPRCGEERGRGAEVDGMSSEIHRSVRRRYSYTSASSSTAAGWPIQSTPGRGSREFATPGNARR